MWVSPGSYSCAGEAPRGRSTTVARTPLDLDDLVEHWTLLKNDQGLVSGKRGATRLGFALLLKFSTQYGRFPRGRFEPPGEVVEFVARQVQVRASDLDAYEWSGRTVEYHRAQIRGPGLS